MNHLSTRLSKIARTISDQSAILRENIKHTWSNIGRTLQERLRQLFPRLLKQKERPSEKESPIGSQIGIRKKATQNSSPKRKRKGVRKSARNARTTKKKETTARRASKTIKESRFFSEKADRRPRQ